MSERGDALIVPRLRARAGWPLGLRPVDAIFALVLVGLLASSIVALVTAGSLQRRADDHQSTLSSLQELASRQDKALRDLEMRMTGVVTRLDSIDGKIGALADNVSKVEVELAEGLENLRAQVDEEVAKQLRNSSGIDAKIDTLRRQVRDFEQQLDSDMRQVAQAEREALVLELKDLQARQAALKQEVVEFFDKESKQRMAEFAGDLEAINQEKLQTFRAEFDDKKGSLMQEMERTAANIETECKSAVASVTTNLLRDEKRLTVAIQDLGHAQERMENEVRAAASGMTSEIRTTMSAAERRVMTSVQASIDPLKGDVRKAQRDADALSSKVRDANSDIAVLRSKIQRCCGRE
uniref:Uncharacterized protein n=1 Tax=Zooxanthella nutricula TaxID=1333877 RepID=A0A7S2VKQ8_9DINO